MKNFVSFKFYMLNEVINFLNESQSQLPLDLLGVFLIISFCCDINFTISRVFLFNISIKRISNYG